jgi:fatty-acyl-CoA synthase
MNPRTIPEAIERAAESKKGYYFLDEGPERFRSYADLFQESLRAAAALRNLDLRRGDRVAILVPEAEDFLRTFYGASLGGFVPVPMSPPLNLGQLDTFLASARHILRTSKVKALITTAQIRRILGMLQAERGMPRHVVRVEELTAPPLGRIDYPGSEDIAFIQFTSGSTSQPKGVVLTHENLRVNIAGIVGPQGFCVNPEVDVGISWLPLFHDMGLIGMALGPVYTVTLSLLMSPLLFIKRPLEFLRAFGRHRGSVTCMPNFGYSLCVKRIPDRELERLDLSSWRAAGCGAEPIQAEILQSFAKKFAPAGFRETALFPCYGMAEHTVAVTFSTIGRPLRTDVVSGADIGERRVATPCAPDEPRAVRFVSCGRPLPAHELRIVDDQGCPLGDRQVGEIQLRGPSVMRGYDGRPDLTAQILRDGWLRTGDLGYLYDGEIFLCGRKKDVIILNGRNYAPQDLEWIVTELPGIRKGAVVAFGTNAFGAREKVVIVAEAKEAQDATEVTAKIRQKILDVIQIQVDEVLIVPPGTIPKTTSGKLQRSRVRERYETGEILRPVSQSKIRLFLSLAAYQLYTLVAPLRRLLADAGWRHKEDEESL